jgi:hypothetical protein
MKLRWKNHNLFKHNVHSASERMYLLPKYDDCKVSKNQPPHTETKAQGHGWGWFTTMFLLPHKHQNNIWDSTSEVTGIYSECQAFHECCRPSMSVISKHLQLLWSDVEMNHRIYLQAESQVSIISGSPHITCLKLILSNVTTLQLQEEARTKSFHLCNITHVSLFLSYWRQKFQK